MRNKVLTLTAVFLFSLSGIPWAQEGESAGSGSGGSGEIAGPYSFPGRGGPTAEQIEKQKEEMKKMMGEFMKSFADWMGLLVEGMARSMAKPEIAENYATFTRNYYQALVTRGFTEEEALKIVIGSRHPSLSGQ